jgi:hypothetical protein
MDAEVHLRERGENAVTRKHVVGHHAYPSPNAFAVTRATRDRNCPRRILLGCKAFKLRLG